MNSANPNPYKRRPFFLLIPVFILAVSGVVMLLWNALLPEILGVKAITYWQAMGLLILCRILFGGFRFGGGGRPPFGPPAHLRRKWMSMTDEEKANFKEEWRKRCENRGQ